MLYFYLERSLSNGNVAIAESTAYTSLKDELFSDEEWLDKSSILKDLENKMISTDFDEIFDKLKALIEFDKVIMSIYMLHYIDSEETRKVVFKSLNRGESYHQLRSAIAKVSGRKLAGRSEIEIIK